MTDLRGATCAIILLTFTLCNSDGFVQAAPDSCDSGEIGVLNGTFDCGTSSGTGGWKYNAQSNSFGNGYSAEIISTPERSSNILELLPVRGQGESPCFPREVLWQEGIKLGETDAVQVVLRFDHLITQRVGYDNAVQVEFTVRRLGCGSYSRAMPLVAQQFEASEEAEGSKPPDWMTSEVYMDVNPCGDENDPQELECDILFKINRLVATEVDTDEQDTDCSKSSDTELVPEIRLDNVQIRVIRYDCDAHPLEQGQPASCILKAENDCGGQAPPCIGQVYAVTDVAPVPGPSAQDCRTFKKSCVADMTCCEKSYLAISATMAEAVAYSPSRSHSLTNAGRSDLNGDGATDGADLAELLAMWGLDANSEPCLSGDVDDSGLVDGADLAILLGDWGGCN